MQFEHQPTPHVTPEDVERVVHRDFPADEYTAVLAILDEYGTEKWHRERARVQLAALKMANASMQRLRAYIDVAKRDYRDVLLAAEYPACGKAGFQVQKLPANERSRIYESDWQQYQEWLKRSD